MMLTPTRQAAWAMRDEKPEYYGRRQSSQSLAGERGARTNRMPGAH